MNGWSSNIRDKCQKNKSVAPECAERRFGRSERRQMLYRDKYRGRCTIKLLLVQQRGPFRYFMIFNYVFRVVMNYHTFPG